MKKSAHSLYPSPTLRSRKLLGVPVVLGVIFCLHGSVWAADVVKADNTTNLNLGASWALGVVPGTGDVAVWNDTVNGANTTGLGGDLSWQGIRIEGTDVGLVQISAGNTLTLGTAGIDLSTSERNLTILSAISLGATQS